jgi:hypothetical protein
LSQWVSGNRWSGTFGFHRKTGSRSELTRLLRTGWRVPPGV